MKINYDEFMLRFLRPALFNGEELELTVEFKNATMYNVDAGTAKAIRTRVGDTVSVFGHINFEGDNSKLVTLYLTGDVLTEFINAYGIRNITGTVPMKLKHVYAAISNYEYAEEKYEEVVGFQVIDIL